MDPSWPSWQWLEAHREAFLPGDPVTDEFGAFVECLEILIFQMSRRKGLQESDAEEVAAWATERIVLNRHQFRFRGAGSFRAWYTRIAENVFVDWFNQERSQPVQPDSGEELWDVVDDTTEDDDLEEESPECRAVASAFNMLKESHQAVLIMRIINNFSNADIANRRGISEAAANQLIHRAREQLRRLLESDPDTSWLSDKMRTEPNASFTLEPPPPPSEQDQCDDEEDSRK